MLAHLIFRRCFVQNCPQVRAKNLHDPSTNIILGVSWQPPIQHVKNSPACRHDTRIPARKAYASGNCATWTTASVVILATTGTKPWQILAPRMSFKAGLVARGFKACENCGARDLDGVEVIFRRWVGPKLLLASLSHRLGLSAQPAPPSLGSLAWSDR